MVFSLGSDHLDVKRNYLNGYERGTFKRVKGSGVLQLDKWSLQLLLEGLDPRELKRPPRWSPRVG